MIFQGTQIRVVLFDVGGVLVELSGMAVFLSWLQNRISAEDFYAVWLASPTVRAFETGRTQAAAFAEQIITELDLPVGREEFLREFRSWNRRLLPGAVELTRRLGPDYTLATLCNTNTLHWPNFMGHRDLFAGFDHHFASHLTGKIKPDEEAFQHVAVTLGCEAPEILFLDDSRLNVAAAKNIGMAAFQVRGPAEAEQALRAAGVLAE